MTKDWIIEVLFQCLARIMSSIPGLGSPANFKGSNNLTMIHVERDLKVHKSFVLGWLIKQHYKTTLHPNVAIGWLLHYPEYTMHSVTVKVHKLNKNIEQWLLSGFPTMYSSIVYGLDKTRIPYYFLNYFYVSTTWLIKPSVSSWCMWFSGFTLLKNSYAWRTWVNFYLA